MVVVLNLGTIPVYSTEDLVEMRESCSNLHLDFVALKVYEEITPDGQSKWVMTICQLTPLLA